MAAAAALQNLYALTIAEARRDAPVRLTRTTTPLVCDPNGASRRSFAYTQFAHKLIEDACGGQCVYRRLIGRPSKRTLSGAEGPTPERLANVAAVETSGYAGRGDKHSCRLARLLKKIKQGPTLPVAAGAARLRCSRRFTALTTQATSLASRHTRLPSPIRRYPPALHRVIKRRRSNPTAEVFIKRMPPSRPPSRARARFAQPKRGR